MHYISTRHADHRVLLSQAITAGIAPDGGLYVPETVPPFATRQFDGETALPQIGARLLEPFAEGDPLGAQLPAICAEAFNFPAPLVHLPEAPAPLSVLELFHGPTAAFKDFGARFLAACLERLRRGEQRKLTILVATSGDTGSAVAAAFHNRPWVDLIVLYLPTLAHGAVKVDALTRLALLYLDGSRTRSEITDFLAAELPRCAGWTCAWRGGRWRRMKWRACAGGGGGRAAHAAKGGVDHGLSHERKAELPGVPPAARICRRPAAPRLRRRARG